MEHHHTLPCTCVITWTRPFPGGRLEEVQKLHPLPLPGPQEVPIWQHQTMFSRVSSRRESAKCGIAQQKCYGQLSKKPSLTWPWIICVKHLPEHGAEFNCATTMKVSISMFWTLKPSGTCLYQALNHNCYSVKNNGGGGVRPHLGHPVVQIWCMAKELWILVKWNMSSSVRKKKAEGFVEPTLLNTVLCTAALVDYLRVESILDAKMTWRSWWDKESEKPTFPYGYVVRTLGRLLLINAANLGRMRVCLPMVRAEETGMCITESVDTAPMPVFEVVLGLLPPSFDGGDWD
jgi:hypothetical protein